MGIEKLIPRANDLGVFLRLLARSATGQPITTYSSHFHGPLPGGELHIVLVDNGRSEILGSDEFRRSLHCIRCGACMNTCPVYRRSGGHSYQSTVPGPIGSILAPASDPAKYHSLPFACSLCGSCTDVCPVKIDLHHQLLTWRRRDRPRAAFAAGQAVGDEAGQLRVAAAVAVSHWWASWPARIVPRLPRLMVYNRLNAWGRQRELPDFPQASFREQFARRAHARRRETLASCDDEQTRHSQGGPGPDGGSGGIARRSTAQWIRYDDPLAQFRRAVESVGGQTLRVTGSAGVEPALRAVPAFAAAAKVVSRVPGVASSVDLDAVADPHDLESVDWAVLPGQFGVAENGTIWVTDAGLKHRAIYFIVQHLALVLPSDQIVHQMHEAYGRASVGGLEPGRLYFRALEDGRH